MFKIFCLTLLFLLLSIGTAAQDDAFQAEILWDTWGVPHIYAENNEALFYAFGWAQMHNHGDRLLELYATSRGRGAEYFGSDALTTDIFANILGLPQLGETWYDRHTDEFQGYLDAFADGMNAYAEANPDLIGDHVRAVLPVDGIDPVRHLAFVGQIGFIGSRAFGQIANWPGDDGTAEDAASDMEEEMEQEETNGSNAWAIAPSRSASGNTLFVANPHLNWSGANTWMEAHLVSPDIEIYGATLLGFPVLAIAFNEDVSWSHTVNTHDGYDLYEVEISPLGAYTLDGEPMQAQVEFLQLPVLQEDGTLEDFRQIKAVTEHGPLVAQSDDGRALAFRIVGEGAGQTYQQWWDMGRADGMEAFLDAISTLQLTTQTVMYADREGNILHLFSGEVPIRNQGDFEFWYDNIIPGDDSSLIWDEMHPFEDLPLIINPESGWLQNANEPPWTTTFPLAIDYRDYPAYMAPEPFMTFRAQSSAGMLYRDDAITFDALREYKHSTEMVLATRIMDDLLSAAAESDDPNVQAAAEVLAAWDLRTDADSQGAVLFTVWHELYNGSVDEFFATPFDLDAEPFTTPDGLGDPEAAVMALAEAAEQVESTYGALDVPWGDVYRLRLGDYDLPANGGTGFLGEFRVVGYRAAEDGLFEAFRGDSYVALVEFSDPVRAEVLVSYGNASQPHSPHVGDQLELFSRQELRTAWLTREAVEANLATRETFP